MTEPRKLGTALPPKIDVLGTGISAATMEDVVGWILDPPPSGMVVAIANVHGVMTARRDGSVASALAGSEIATTDGMPLAWALRALGHRGQARLDGLSVTRAAIDAGLERGTRHFFYGSTEETLAAMERNLRSTYPAIEISGMHSPPFGVPDPDESAVLDAISSSGTNVVWVGLGVPRQEVWMHRVRYQLPGVCLVGVGAVFDWLAGNIAKAPQWVQKSGLEWLYRLAKEPRRMWRRYMWNNPGYVVLAGRQVIATRLAAARERARPR